jgi:hypothetical protein
MTTLKELFPTRELEIYSKQVSERPDGLCPSKGGTYWLVVLSYDGKSLPVWYTLGMAHKGSPDKYDVLSSMLTDATSETFDDWCSEYGYENDSFASKRIYDACLQQGKETKWLLGKDLFEQAKECEQL